MPPSTTPALLTSIWAPFSTPVPKDSTTFPFLKLPAEIRVMIYKEIPIPYEASMEDYKGLYLACHDIKKEMDFECTKMMKTCMQDLKNAIGADEQVSRKFHVDFEYGAEDFEHIRHVNLFLGHDAFLPRPFQSSNTKPHVPGVIRRVLELHLDKLTFVLEEFVHFSEVYIDDSKFKEQEPVYHISNILQNQTNVRINAKRVAIQCSDYTFNYYNLRHIYPQTPGFWNDIAKNVESKETCKAFELPGWDVVVENKKRCRRGVGWAKLSRRSYLFALTMEWRRKPKPSTLQGVAKAVGILWSM